ADLQIVCDALYRDLTTIGEPTFSLARYQDLGGVTRILGGYLQRVVKVETNPQQVRDVLKAMITAQGNRVLSPATQIARLAGVEDRAAMEILRHLDRTHRLVHLRDQAGEAYYELAHDVLGPRILAWIQDPTEQEAKIVHDLLRIELHNWRR